MPLLWQHMDQTSVAAQWTTRLTRSHGCSHRDCRRVVESSSMYESARALEVVVNRYEGSTAGVWAVYTPCMVHRRIMRQQQGRGSYGYRDLIFTGVAPVAGMDFIASSNAVRERENQIQQESFRERARQMRAASPELLRQHLSILPARNMSGWAATTAPDVYGRTYVQAGSLRMTPAEAVSFATLITALASEARNETEEAMLRVTEEA